MDVYQASIQNWAMAVDKQGLLYVANNDGVLQFDGAQWNLIKIANQNYVFSIAFDKDDRLYVGSYNDLGYLEKDKNARFIYYSLINILPDEYSNVADIRQTIEFNNEVFFNNNRNVYVYKNGKFKIIPIPNRRLYKLKNKLFLVTDKDLLIYRNGKFEEADFNKDLGGMQISVIADFQNNTCLILDDKGKVYIIDLAAQKNKLRLLNLSLSSHPYPVTSIVHLDNGNTALRSNEGYYIIDSTGRQIGFNSKETLGTDLNTGFRFLDNNHNLWIGTNSCISQVITSSPLTYFDKLNGLDGMVLSMAKKDGHLYIGTDKGLFYKDDYDHFTLVKGTAGENWNLFNFHQKLYLAHGNGVFEINGTNATPLIQHNYIQTLGELKGHADQLIMGTYNTGIWLLKKLNGIWQEKKIKGFDEETRFIQQDNEGNIWISHYNKGIFKLRLNERSDSVVSKTFYDTTKGLPSAINNRIYSLKSGKIVATTMNGIYSFNKTRNKFEPDTAFKRPNRQPFCIYTLTESENGDLYFWGAPSQNNATAGIYIKQNNGTYLLKWLTPFDKVAVHTSGIRVDVDAPVLATDEHNIWYGMGDKVVNYNNAQIAYSNEPFSAIIKQAWAGDSPFYTNGNKLSGYHIPFSKNVIRLNFTSSFYEDPEHTQYQYKLLGLEDKWSDWSVNKEANITNLSYGDYTVIVRAKNIYGNLSHPVKLTFSIATPWYQTLWAYLIYLTVILLLFRLVNRINLNWIKKQKLLLEHSVSIKTIELNNKTEEILEKNREILEQSQELLKLNATKDKLFSIISHDLRAPIAQLKQVLALMESNDLSFEEFELYLPEVNESLDVAFGLVENLLFWAKNQMTGMQINPVLFDLTAIVIENFDLFKPITNKKKIELFNEVKDPIWVFCDKDMISLVLRNLINNAVKFTPVGGGVTINAVIKHGYVTVAVQDSGPGISKDDQCLILEGNGSLKNGTAGEKGSGLGLILCKEFIEKNGGELGIESELGRGSEFFFTLQVK